MRLALCASNSSYDYRAKPLISPPYLFLVNGRCNTLFSLSVQAIFCSKSTYENTISFLGQLLRKTAVKLFTCFSMSLCNVKLTTQRESCKVALLITKSMSDEVISEYLTRKCRSVPNKKEHRAELN